MRACWGTVPASDEIRWRVGMIEVICFRNAHVGWVDHHLTTNPSQNRTFISCMYEERSLIDVLSLWRGSLGWMKLFFSNDRIFFYKRGSFVWRKRRWCKDPWRTGVQFLWIVTYSFSIDSSKNRSITLSRSKTRQLQLYYHNQAFTVPERRGPCCVETFSRSHAEAHQCSTIFWNFPCWNFSKWNFPCWI